MMNYQLEHQLEDRLRSLKSEYAAGQQMLLDLEAKQVDLQHTLLRISGAIQVLEEERQKFVEVSDRYREQVEYPEIPEVLC